jgi:putative membrane protein
MAEKKDNISRNAKARKRTNLATERTKFANERTFMAQARTGFSLVIVGITMLEFFDQDRYRVIAISMIPFGVAIAVYGLVRYIKRRKLIKEHSLGSYREGYDDRAHRNLLAANGSMDHDIQLRRSRGVFHPCGAAGA